MNVSPFQLLKRSTADALSTRASAALAQWGAAWTTLPDHALGCAAASEQAGRLAAGELRHRLLDGGVSVWAAVPAGMERHLEQLVFGLSDLDAASGRHLASRLGGGVADDALEDLLQTLFGALTGRSSQAAPAQAPGAQLTRPGSGAVICSVQLGERALRLLLPAAVLPAPPPLRARPGAAPLTTLQRALAALPVPLSVELCRTELTLGYLRTLAVGDVLALPMATDQELRVTGPGDTTVCHAHLGALDGAYAVELIKAAR
ncbi:FliM/FliN family flagellar motor switch protein [Massilia atriviolacea]|uniref:FliM/FliN family flagellar motor switch protein n=1 Tax=Massilia atriviolacea TaxID=2495579 RepID=A0A430HFT1_9BURK|nr:FliM/FliN family flagellar motor C-terminal domain-containing protein [Massilia atriviolacea]RSZ56388.1 FliM/FliN family flagellar motor switch protein [Massilia atriviolacea]